MSENMDREGLGPLTDALVEGETFAGAEWEVARWLRTRLQCEAVALFTFQRRFQRLKRCALAIRTASGAEEDANHWEQDTVYERGETLLWDPHAGNAPDAKWIFDAAEIRGLHPKYQEIVKKYCNFLPSKAFHSLIAYPITLPTTLRQIGAIRIVNREGDSGRGSPGEFRAEDLILVKEAASHLALVIASARRQAKLTSTQAYQESLVAQFTGDSAVRRSLEYLVEDLDYPLCAFRVRQPEGGYRVVDWHSVDKHDPQRAWIFPDSTHSWLTTADGTHGLPPGCILHGGRPEWKLRSCYSEPVTGATGPAELLVFDWESMTFHPAARRLIRGAAQALSRQLQHVVVPRPRDFVKDTSQAYRQLEDQLTTVGPTDASVFLEGEYGTGKQILARALHDANSKRQSKPFLAVHCGAFEESDDELFGRRDPEKPGEAGLVGYFERIQGGTLFLDEIHALSLATQARLVRVLEDRQVWPHGAAGPRRVDFRLVTASSENLARRCDRGTFRSDLFHLIRVVQLQVPPLRKRLDRLEEFAGGFLAKHAERYGRSAPSISGPALQALRAYSWPGNIRELKNAMEHALIFCKGTSIGPADLPESVTGGQTKGTHPIDCTLAEFDDWVVRSLYARVKLQTEVAEQLEIRQSMVSTIINRSSTFHPPKLQPTSSDYTTGSLAERRRHYAEVVLAHHGSDPEQAANYLDIKPTRLAKLLRNTKKKQPTRGEGRTARL